jgi:mRNA interferase MazF
MYQKGDIVLVNFPFSDGSKFKPRPALVISSRLVNQTGDYVLVQITSHSWGDALSEPLITSDFRGGALPKPSEVRVHKLFTANEKLILAKATRVTKACRIRILKRLIGLM